MEYEKLRNQLGVHIEIQFEISFPAVPFLKGFST